MTSLYITIITFLQYRPKKRNFGDFEIIRKQASFDMKLSAIIEDKVSSRLCKFQLDQLNFNPIMFYSTGIFMAYMIQDNERYDSSTFGRLFTWFNSQFIYHWIEN